MRPRSVIPGRQRWDIGVVLGRPRVAELLQASLRESRGIEMVYANPATGRLLVCHDTALSRGEVDQLVRKTVALAARQAMTLTGSMPPKPGVMPSRGRRRQNTGSALVVSGGAAVALVVTRATFVRPSPLVGLGGVVVATVVVVRRAWRRSRLAQHVSAVSLRSKRHPLLQIAGSHKRQFYVASCASILVQILDMVPSILISWMAVVLITGKSAALVRLGLASVASQLWFLTGVTALASVVAAVLSFIAGVLWRDLAQSVQQEWRTEMYAHVQRVGLRYLEGERTTRIAGILTNDINQLGRFFAASADYFLKLGTSFLVLVPVFLFLTPGIAWVAFLPVPIVAWLSFSYHERSASDLATSSENVSLLNSQLVNNLEASATVKSFGAEQYEIDRIHHLSAVYRQTNRRIDKRAAAYTPTVRMCAMVSLSGILLLGGLDVLAGTLPFGVFNSLVGAPQLVLWQLPGLGDAVDQYQRTVAALGRVLDLRSLQVEPGGSGRPLDVAKVQGEMVLDGVTFAYPGRPPVLRNVSMRMAARKTTGIVGVTGAGKTTIAKLMLRFQDVESGRVLLDGLDIREVRLQDLRKAIGFVAQDAFLFDGTIDDNIRYGSFDAEPERVVSAARLAQADDFVEALPSRYDTMIGERGATLSGGQKQRLSLARAIVKSPPIVILDEATSAVDNETEAAIQRALKDFARDRTLVIIAHRLSTIRHADWIYVMDRGGVVAEEGTHHELIAREGVYASLWRLQIGEASA